MEKIELPESLISLNEVNIFQLTPLIENVSLKKSAFHVTEDRQVLCLVDTSNVITFYYTNNKDEPLKKNNLNSKVINWFKNANKSIEDICFYPSSSKLMVLCSDNTLHTVPTLWILDKVKVWSFIFKEDAITSFDIPTINYQEKMKNHAIGKDVPGRTFSNPIVHDDENNAISIETTTSMTTATTTAGSSSSSSSSQPANNSVCNDDTNNDDVFHTNETDSNEKPSTSVVAVTKDNCLPSVSNSNDSIEFVQLPCPTCITGWITNDAVARAIIGYSDGTICVLKFENPLQFIAKTYIEKGAVTKMEICRDAHQTNVILMINSSINQQWKLFLEQTKIGYVFPDIVTMIASAAATTNMNNNNNNDDKKLPVEPDQQSPSIFRARLASLRDLGAKTIGALKLKLAESRMKTNEKERIKAQEASLALMGAPGLIPELLTTPSGPLFTVQYLKGNYLLSALHTCSDILSVHGLDIYLIPMYLYKLPKYCSDVLITTNFLYTIQKIIKPNKDDDDDDDDEEASNRDYSNNDDDDNANGDGNVKDNLNAIEQANKEEIDDCDCDLKSANTSDIHDNTDIIKEKIIVDDNQNDINIDIDKNINDNNNNNNNGNTPAVDSTTCDENIMNDRIENECYGIGVIGCKLAATQIGDNSDFPSNALLTQYPFYNEKILNLYKISDNKEKIVDAPFIIDVDDVGIIDTDNNNNNNADDEQQYRQQTGKNEKTSSVWTLFGTAFNYVKNRKRLVQFDDGDELDEPILRNEFPAIEMEKCIVVTDTNLYCIEINEMHQLKFLQLAEELQWEACEEFCKVFHLNFNECIEYAGDVFLQRKKLNQALIAYSLAKVPPVKRALKLAMCCENVTLMNLCAMALNIHYIIKSKYSCSKHIDYLIESLQFFSDNIIDGKSPMLMSLMRKKMENHSAILTGVPCSDFSYETHVQSDIQLSNSSQFHLSNLLLITLTERTLKEKKMFPLWNFLVTNKRYHTNMSSIVLCQSGLYSSVILLALVRGSHIDGFCGLVSVTHKEYSLPSELNIIFYNLSDEMFMESIIYLKNVSIEYFDVIQSKIDTINEKNLERLKMQLNPFSAVFRPIVSQLSSNTVENHSNDLHLEFLDFCKLFIETFILINIKLYIGKNKSDNFINALNTIHVRHEERQFAIKIENSAPIAAGYSHCACIMDGVVYMWGSNGVNCTLSSNPTGESISSPKCLGFISNLGLEVHAVKCGRSHTLIVTNNGVYAMGANQLGQLGIGKKYGQALHPMLIKEFDGKNINLVEAGQYHNAIVADGKLYTWGWGVYGQLGNGNIEDVHTPEVVPFFCDKKIKQISLGYAHSLVLCTLISDRMETNLYVFGSNHVGQLGIGQSPNEYHQNNVNINNAYDSNNYLRSVVPIKLNVGENIRLIHTKFFTNFLVTNKNYLYTWGISPQALRFLNQARKRSKANQKAEEALRNEFNLVATESDDSLLNEQCGTTQEQQKENPTETFEMINKSDANEINSTNDNGNNNNNEDVDLNGNKSSTSSTTKQQNVDVDKINNSEIISSDDGDGGLKDTKEESNGNTIIIINNNNNKNNNTKSDEKLKEKLKTKLSFDEEYTDHYLPMLVNTGEVDGEIIQISSGLFHSALITDQYKLYTWGKNLEKQLGKDNSRMDVLHPIYIDSIENPLHVECGADFTLVMTSNFNVKAFGNNSYGQCGKDCATEKHKFAGKLVRLRISKRVVRIPDGSQYVDIPYDIYLPRPKIRFGLEPIRYLKSVPKFNPRYIIKNNLINLLTPSKQSSPSPPPSVSSSSSKIGTSKNTTLLNPFSTSNKNTSKKSLSMHKQHLSKQQVAQHLLSISASASSSSSSSPTPSSTNHLSTAQDYNQNDFIHYCLFIFHGIYDPVRMLDLSILKEFKLRILMLNYRVKEAFSLCISDILCSTQIIKIFEFFTRDSSVVPMHRDDLKFMIYEMFLHVIQNNLNITDIESFFHSNLDYYLFALAYILFFNNNNSELELKVLANYANIFNGFNTMEPLEKSHIIFNAVSTNLKASICQRLIDYNKKT